MPLRKDPQGKSYLDLSDALSGDPPHSGWAKWFGGVVCPLLPLWGAISCWITQKGFIPGQGRSRFELEGLQAIVLGFLLLAIAFFLPFSFFFGELSKTLAIYGIWQDSLWHSCRWMHILPFLVYVC